MTPYVRSVMAAALAAVVSAGSVVGGTAQAAPYRFEVLGEATGLNPYLTRDELEPAVNDKGTAAFVLPGAGSPGYRLQVGTPGSVREVLTPGVFNRGAVAINNRDRVAFLGVAADLPDPRLSETSAFAVTPGGAPAVVINRAQRYGDISRQIGISDSGQVIATIFAVNAPPDEVLVGDGTTTTRVYYTFGHVGYPRMSSGGDYAFTYNGDQSFGDGFRTSRMVFDKIGYSPPEYGALMSAGDGDVANGWTVFNGRFLDGPPALYKVQDGSRAQRVAGSEGLGGAVAINDSGTVALLTSGGTAAHPGRLYVFHGDGPELVLAEGDALLGSTVTDLSFSPNGFNNLEQFAFLAHLADGRDVFVLASPVPEPGAAAALVVGAAALGLRRRGRGD